MVALLSFFLALCLTDRPLALAFLTVYVIHHAWCHLYHVAVFSGIGQVGGDREYRNIFDPPF
jgi:hypothetical protein